MASKIRTRLQRVGLFAETDAMSPHKPRMVDLLRWNPLRKRSTGQKNNILAASKSRWNKENTLHQHPSSHTCLTASNDAISANLITSQDQILAEKNRVDRFYKDLRNERKNSSRARGKLEEMRAGFTEALNTARSCDEVVVEKEAVIHELQEALEKAGEDLEACRETVSDLRGQTKKSRNRMHARISRTSAKLKIAVSKPATISLKEKGVLTEKTREMTRNLVMHGVSRKESTNVIKAVAKGVGIELEDTIDGRSVWRTEKEGYIASQLQLVADIERSSGEYLRISLNSYMR